MANVYLQDSTLTAIGNAIRTKGGTTEQLLPSEMPNAITNLPSGGGADELDIIKSLSNHPHVTAVGDNALAEAGYAGGSAVITTAGTIPLAAMGLQGYENFMKHCICLCWQGDRTYADSSVYLYSLTRLVCLPVLGSFNNRYVYVHTAYDRYYKNATSGGTDISMTGWASFSLGYCLDTQTGIVYKINTNSGSHQSVISASLNGTASGIGGKVSQKVYYLKKI